MLKRTLLGAIAATVGMAVAMTSGQAFAENDRFMKVLKRGTLIVGVAPSRASSTGSGNAGPLLRTMCAFSSESSCAG